MMSMAEKKKRVFGSKRPTSGQLSMMRFNVAEETTETVVDSFSVASEESNSTPRGKTVSQVDRFATKREKEVAFVSKNAKAGPKEVIPLFADNDDMDLFEKQKTEFQEIKHDAMEEKEPVCSVESSSREVSTEPDRLLSDDSDYQDGLEAVSIVESGEEEVTERGPIFESDEGRSSSCFSVERDTELIQSPEPLDNPLLQDLARTQGDSDSASMSSDHEIDGFEGKKCKLFVTEHPLTASVEPSTEESEEDSELKQQDDSFRIVDDHFHQSPAVPTKKPPPPRPPPPKQRYVRETMYSSKSKANDEVEPDVKAAAVRETKAPSESLYWSLEFQLLLIFSTVVFVFNIVNTSVYLSGVFDGVVLVFLTACTILYLNLRSDEDSHRSRLESLKRTKAINSKPIRLAMQPPRCLEDNFTAIHFYDNPQNHRPKHTAKLHVIMDGHSIHISVVEGTHMSYHRLADEDSDEGGKQVTNTNILDLRGATVQLAPSVLSHKQQFSKKFPIKLTFKYSIPDICGSRSHELIHNDKRVLYLFAPTSRKKEMWFWRLQLACGATDDESPNLTTPSHFDHYVKYMCRLIPDRRPFQSKNPTPICPPRKQRRQVEPHGVTISRSNDNESSGIPTVAKQAKPMLPPPSIDWFNAFMGRLFWDAWNEKYLRDYLHRKWQHKLEKTKTPSFMRPLEITDLCLGDHLPVVTNVSKPYVNPQGIWVELDLDYKEGTFCITIETNLQFLPAGDKDTTDGISVGGIGNTLSYTTTSSSVKSKVKRREGDSDIDSGAEEDEERTEEPSIAIMAPDPKQKSEKMINAQSPEHRTSKSAFLRIADKVLQSSIVRKAAQTRLGQHVTGKMNNWRLVLIVQVTSLKGQLLVNMAPPPTDRIW